MHKCISDPMCLWCERNILGVTIEFRNEEDCRDFHSAFQQWQNKDVHKPNNLSSIVHDVVDIRKVDQANRCRAKLRQTIVDYEAELAAICSAMGERPVHIRQSDQNARNLKEDLGKIVPQLEEMNKRKIERKNQFVMWIPSVFELSPGQETSTSDTRTESHLEMTKFICCLF